MATKFIAISVDILRDTNLTAIEKFVLAEIEQLSQLDYGCIASNQHFADLIGIARPNASRTISSLEKKGYITTEIEKGTRNTKRSIKMINRCYQNDTVVVSKRLETKDNKQDNITINTIIEYLNQKTNKRYNSKSKDAQLIKQLLNKDYKLEDFKLVIDHKVSEWLNDDEMSKFLRPSTLFGSKFDRYLNEAIPTQSKPTRRLG